MDLYLKTLLPKNYKEQIESYITNKTRNVDESVIPIEVKSGKEYTKHKVLSSYLSVDNWRMNKAYVLYKGNIKVDGNIVYLPIYMAGLLPLDNVSFPSLNIELSGI